VVRGPARARSQSGLTLGDESRVSWRVQTAGVGPEDSRYPGRTPAQNLGDAAEVAAADRLADDGWTILARNVHVGRYELDVVAVDPGPPPALVIVEVRWRGSRAFGLPEETVDHRKRARLRAAAYGLLDLGTLPSGVCVPHLPLRFDLIVVEPGGRLRHHRHAL
jgi:putative endonuclease